MPLSNLHFNTNELVAIDSSIVFTIPYTDIVFIRCAKPYLEIHLRDKQYFITQRLAFFGECLPHYFCMCNKSEIVNLMHIKEINKENDSRTPPVQHLLAIADKENDQITKEALDNWYLSPVRDYVFFARKYPMNGELKMQLPQINLMHKWTVDEKIAFTPTFFINGYQLPENYHVSDLKYFLSV